MNMFIELKIDEMQKANGGGVIGVTGYEVAGLLITAYLAVREMVREEGRNDAYRDLGM